MKRWNGRKAQYVENRAIDAFIEELLAVCRKHGLCIAHEDSHGAFIIENLKETRVNWLRAAHDETVAQERTASPNQAPTPNSNADELYQRGLDILKGDPK